MADAPSSRRAYPWSLTDPLNVAQIITKAEVDSVMLRTVWEATPSGKILKKHEELRFLLFNIAEVKKNLYCKLKTFQYVGRKGVPWVCFTYHKYLTLIRRTPSPKHIRSTVPENQIQCSDIWWSFSVTTKFWLYYTRKGGRQGLWLLEMRIRFHIWMESNLMRRWADIDFMVSSVARGCIPR